MLLFLCLFAGGCKRGTIKQTLTQKTIQKGEQEEAIAVSNATRAEAGKKQQGSLERLERGGRSILRAGETCKLSGQKGRE